MNPLQRTRARASRAWWTARDGTARTTRWVTGGVASAPRRVASRLRPGAAGDAKQQGAAGDAKQQDSGPGLWERSGGRLVDAIRARPRAAAAWAGGAAITILWIGWTAYAWIENGAAAGIGVLVSWPAVFAALAIVFSPFVGAGLLVRRHRVAAAGPGIAAAPAEPAGPHTPEKPDGTKEPDGAGEPEAAGEPSEPDKAG